MNFMLRQLGLVILNRLVSQEVIKNLVAALVLLIEARVKASTNTVDDKVLAEIDKVISQEELVAFIMVFLKGNVKA